jgi:hypothetical protein
MGERKTTKQQRNDGWLQMNAANDSHLKMKAECHNLRGAVDFRGEGVLFRLGFVAPLFPHHRDGRRSGGEVCAAKDLRKVWK